MIESRHVFRPLLCDELTLRDRLFVMRRSIDDDHRSDDHRSEHQKA